MEVNLNAAVEKLTRYGLLRPRLLIIASIGILVLVLIFMRTGGGTDAEKFITVKATRGDILQSVASTGLLQAVITVQVGSQVSGRIQELHADFNSVVEKGQILAVIDPASFEAQVSRTRAAVSMAKANIKNAEATLGNRTAELDSSKANLIATQVSRKDAKLGMERSQGLFDADLISERDLEQAQAAYEGAVAREDQAAAQVQQVNAGIRSAAAQLEQARASVKQAVAELNINEVNLKYTKIIAPINGVVIERNVDIGQTVAASFQAPILFLIANDLTRMQVIAQVDEADIGALSENAEVEFTVDAFPREYFKGRISEIRLSSLLPGTATTTAATSATSNVVVYNVIIDVENHDLMLRPSMTANVTFTVSKEENVIKIANAALRYRPSNQTPPNRNDPIPFSVNKETHSEKKDKKEVNSNKPRYGTSNPVQYLLDKGSPPLTNKEELPLSNQAPQVTTERYGIRPGIKIHFPRSRNSNNYRDGLVWTLEHDNNLKPHPVKLGITDGRETAVLEGDLIEGDLVITGEYISEEERMSRSGSPLGGIFGRRRSGSRSGRSRRGGARR